MSPGTMLREESVDIRTLEDQFKLKDYKSLKTFYSVYIYPFMRDVERMSMDEIKRHAN